MAMTHNKQITLSTKEKVKRLKSLVQDATDLKFNGKLIKDFKKQLKEQEEILQKELKKEREELSR